MTIKKSHLVFLFFILLQGFIYFIFINYGRDTPTYINMAKGIGTNYLEYFWRFIFSIFDSISTNYYLKFYFMYFMFSIAAIVLINSSLAYTRSFSKMIMISLFILSQEIAYAGGAFRQGIVVMFFSTYLLKPDIYKYILAILGHWSGYVYILFNKYIMLLLSLIFPIIFMLLLYDWSNIINTFSVIDRILFYLNNPFHTDGNMMYGAVINKLLYFILFVVNIKVIYKLEIVKQIKFIKYISLFSPLIQIAMYLITGSQQILQRAGMILDPFSFVFIVLIICYGNFYSRLIVYFLIFSKIIIRFLIVLG